jgi:hypothetical protein
MPYSDPAKQRAAQANWYREKYENDKRFRKKEADRKAAWLQTEAGKESNAAASARARVKRKKVEKAAAKKGKAAKPAKKAAKPAKPAKKATKKAK